MKRGLISLERAQKWGPSSLKTHVREAPFKRDLNLASKFQPLQLFPQLFFPAAARKFMKLIVGPFSNPFAFKAVACSPSCRSAWPLAAHPH